jgi:methionyl aminopeptidase
MTISIKDAQGAAGMRVAGRLASEVLDYLTPFVQPGVTTNELDKLAHDYMVNVQGCVPAPLNYQPPGYAPYPKSICTSINNQVCHGIPNDKAPQIRSGNL